MTIPPPRGRFTSRLGFQVAFLLAVVLLPLTAISVARSAALSREAQARSEAAVIGETLHAASYEMQLIQAARGTVATLAAILPSVADDPEACSAALHRVADVSNAYTLVAFVPPDGVMRCSSKDRIYDFSQSSISRDILAKAEPRIIVNRDGPVSGTSILGVTHPVMDRSGKQLGYVSVSLPHNAMTIPERTDGVSTPPLELVTFDAAGVVMTATNWEAGYEGALPAERSLTALVGPDPVAFTAEAENGEMRSFSVVPLVPNVLYALGTWPVEGPVAAGLQRSFVPLILPVLMWLASLIVAWFAVERLVIRHIRKLRRSAISFAGGSRVVGNIDMTGAAVEIRELAEAYEQMTETILHDEAELEDNVHQREVLLREVHHRVKNNLQLIASIMNMQMRRTQSAEAKQTLRNLQDRVMSLATIHRELYQTTGLSDVDASELLSKIVRQITAMTDRPDRRLVVQSEFADIRMTPDQAVPLALLTAEAVTNAIKYASAPAGSPARLAVFLTRQPGLRAKLCVRNSVSTEDNEPPETTERTGLGSQLISAFAMQLGGQAVSAKAKDQYELTIEFELRPLSEGENGDAPVRQANMEPQLGMAR
ncbi:MAG: sensor histidine kinase [Rhodobacteraceae bacterium]|nr:sensor histidine kinase [Paracoccaceae bacterium]